MDQNHIKPLWRAESSILPRSPHPQAVPWLWKWSRLHELACQSGELVTIRPRRPTNSALGLSNPGLQGGRPYATPTLWAAIQWLNGHEVEPSTSSFISGDTVHHQTGKEPMNTVKREQNLFGKREFGLDPPWCWRDHGSDGDGPTHMDGQSGHTGKQLPRRPLL